MVRHAISTIGLLLLVAALLPTAPARAQFDTIFGNGPPRPPADIPSSPPQQQPGYYPGQTDPQRSGAARRCALAGPAQLPGLRGYPAAQRQQPQSLRPAASRDEPPAQPMPSPMNLPPAARPGGGTIESQPLAPPPGTEPAPAGQPTPSPSTPQQANRIAGGRSSRVRRRNSRRAGRASRRPKKW